MNWEENSIAQATITKAMPMAARERILKKGKTCLLSRGRSEEEGREKLNMMSWFLTCEVRRTVVLLNKMKNMHHKRLRTFTLMATSFSSN